MSKRRKNGQPSSYSDFILDDLQTMFGVDNKVVMLNLSTQNIAPSQWLLEALDMSSTMSLSTEKAKSEGIVLPILLALNRLNPNQFKIFSGSTFDVDKSLSLVGRCDFMLSSNTTANISAPIISIFEAKNDNLEDWYGQCGSKMYAARLFNKQKNKPFEVIHGAVTNGFEWQFLKLQDDILYIDIQRYFIGNLPQLLGALQTIVDYYKSPQI